MKTCSSCHIEQPESGFRRRASSKDGLAATCKTCAKEKYQQWAKANPEKIAARHAAWSAAASAHPAKAERDRASYLKRRDKILVRKSEYWESLPEARRAILRERARGYSAAYRGRHPERSREASAAWRVKNPGAGWAATRRWYDGRPLYDAHRKQLRRERATQGPGCSERDLRRVISSTAGVCFYCRVAPAMTIDHVVPLKRGGRHAVGNLVPACKRCNSSKGSLLLIEWRASKRHGLPSRLAARYTHERGPDHG